MNPILLFLLAAAPSAEVWRFQKMAEPNEGAFTLLAPAGWRIAGGIRRVDANAAGGALNATGAKLDLTLSSADGRTQLRWYPETNYFDMRGNAVQAMFPPGSNYNGAPVWPKMDALAFLEQFVLRRTRPQAASVRLTGRYPLPKAAASYQDVVRQMGIPIPIRFDAAILTVEYQEGGGAWQEVFYTAIQDLGNSGLWANKDTFSMRAPAGELDKVARVVSLIVNSVELDPKWVEGEIRGQIQRNEIAIRTQQEIARLDREIVEHRRRTSAEISGRFYHTLMGTEQYVNPLTKKTETGSNAWAHRWVNRNGEAIYTDDPGWDPVRAGLSGYVKSPIRQGSVGR